MPHDLATANRHDHAWTENWAPNIWMLCTTLSPMRPRNAQRQSDQEDHLYGTKGTWINCPTCFPLLNVGFMTSLRRTDCFILIWMCNAALAVSRHCHFSKLSRLQIETDKKRERSLFCYMLCSKTMSVELHGRSHPASRIYEGDLLSGLWTLWVSGVEGVQGFLRGSWLKRSHESKIFKQFQGSQGSKGPKVNGSQGLIGFNGYQRSTGFRVSRDSGFPMLSRALKEVDVSIIQSFRVHGMEDFQGLKARGLEGERAPRFS